MVSGTAFSAIKEPVLSSSPQRFAGVCAMKRRSLFALMLATAASYPHGRNCQKSSTELRLSTHQAVHRTSHDQRSRTLGAFLRGIGSRGIYRR